MFDKIHITMSQLQITDSEFFLKIPPGVLETTVLKQKMKKNAFWAIHAFMGEPVSSERISFQIETQAAKIDEICVNILKEF